MGWRTSVSSNVYGEILPGQAILAVFLIDFGQNNRHLLPRIVENNIRIEIRMHIFAFLILCVSFQCMCSLVLYIDNIKCHREDNAMWSACTKDDIILIDDVIG